MVFLFYRFDYSPEFLAWALKPPGYLKEWHCGVRVTKSNKLVGFISAVPAHMRYIFFIFSMVLSLEEPMLIYNGFHNVI